jgi:hypothetical protein
MASIDPGFAPHARERPMEWRDAAMVLLPSQPPGDEYYKSIPEHIEWTLRRVLTDNGVRYEATTYGYISRCLETIFPSHRWFQVCQYHFVLMPWFQTDFYGKIDAQHPLRPTTSSTELVSMGSEGNIHANFLPGGQIY